MPGDFEGTPYDPHPERTKAMWDRARSAVREDEIATLEAELVAATRALTDAVNEAARLRTALFEEAGHRLRAERERDRLRTGVEAWVANCGLCGATGVIDSGGVTPWGAGINRACPDCSPLRALLREAPGEHDRGEIS